MGVVLLLFFTNPSDRTHCDSIKNRVKKDHPIIGTVLGRTPCALTVYNDYILFSTTEISGDLVSIGALGKVYVRDLDF